VSAAEQQAYEAAPVHATCSNCVNLQFDRELADWMVRSNAFHVARGCAAPYGENAKEHARLRCGIGGFPVVMTGVCSRHQREGVASNGSW
jgi:hypothetical protein